MGIYKLRHFFLTFSALFIGLSYSYGQDMPNSVDEVINWSFSIEYTSCDEARIIATVDQKDGWHVYAQKQPEGAISFPTEFNFVKTSDYELVGRVKEYGVETHHGQFPEKLFPGKKAIFKQKIKIKSKKDFKIHLDYAFIACKEACFPPTDGMTDIKVKGCKEAPKAEVSLDDADSTNTSETIHEDAESIKSGIGFQAFAIKQSDTEYDLIIKPEISQKWLLSNNLSVNFIETLNKRSELTFPASHDTTINGKAFAIYSGGEYSQSITLDTSNLNDIYHGEITFSGLDSLGRTFVSTPTEFSIPINEAIIRGNSDETAGNSYWGIFWLAFGGGLFALLTPCVFPMIPMTVSFFTKGSENKRKGLFRGVMYGFFILLIYVLLSIPFHLMDSLNPNILNNIATNGPLNIFFFIMLFVFALSFLGAFEIVLPAKWTNKADTKSNLGGLIGIFFMALTLALVSFSCTGPILGSLLASASGGGAWNLTWGMAGFGLALGLPFALFAIFPSWLNSLPSSGGWLNNVKVVLGFLELAFAFKFLSNADLSVQAHLLERELFIAIWIGIFAAMTLYLFGIYQTKHDSPITGGLGTFRIMLATITLMFTVYMIPGLFGAPLKLISAFPPPPSYSEIPYGIHGHAPDNLPDGAEFEHGLTVFHDFDVAQKYATEQGKPLMLDFTGLNCVNCRKMEVQVWSNEKVHKIMDENFIVVSLFIDDKQPLPAPLISPYSGRELVTKGDRWSDMQSSLYKKNTQPQYIALDENGQMMNSDATYMSHGKPELFETWLQDNVSFYETPLYYGQVIFE